MSMNIYNIQGLLYVSMNIYNIQGGNGNVAMA